MSETLTENSADVIAAGKAEDYHTNEKQENLMSREASVLGTGESISGCTEEEIEEACENNMNDGDSHFESRTASMSFNSDTTENSFRYVSTADEGKVEENSAPALDYKTDTVAPDELSSEPEQQQNPAIQDNPFLQSVKYLEKHQILRLFQNFAAQIVYNRPDNPLQYLVDELERSREETQQVPTRVPAESEESDSI